MKEQSQSNASKVLKGISSQTLVTIVLGIVEIVSFSIMSRLLSQEDFGYYAAITAITTIFASFSDTGIGSALIQHKEINQRYINNAFTLSLIFGLFISLILLFTAGPISKLVIDESLKKPLMLMSITLLCNCLVSVNFSLMQRKLQFLRIGLINLISLVLTTIVAIILAIKGYGYYAILTKVVMSSVLTLILSYLLVRTKFGIMLDKTTAKSIWGFSGWLMASGLFRNFAQQMDRLLMGRLLSVTALGTYNRPKEFITQISTRLNGIFDSALFPVLSSIQDDKNSIVKAYKTSLYYMNIFSMCLALLFIFNSELIIRVFLGSEWLYVDSLFKVLSIVLIFNINGRLADCYFRSLALTKQQFFFRVGEMFINIIFIIAGARLGNIFGVAISLIISNVIIIFIKLGYLSRHINYSFLNVLKTLLNSWRFSIIACPILLLFALILPHNWLGNILCALAFGIVTILIFIVFPILVGKQYKEEIYCRIRIFIKSKYHI